MMKFAETPEEFFEWLRDTAAQRAAAQAQAQRDAQARRIEAKLDRLLKERGINNDPRA